MSRWYLLCDSCGRKITNTEARKRWDGMIVCPNDWEPKHPSLTYRPSRHREEGTTAARSGLVRPEPADTFVIILCDLHGSSGAADFATADCAHADMVLVQI